MVRFCLRSKPLCYLLPILLLMLLNSCSRIELNELEENVNTTYGEMTTMRLKTRTSEGENLSYPIHVFLFDPNSGNLINYHVITEETESSVFQVAQGKYRIIAITGIDDTFAKSIVSTNDIYTMPAENVSFFPIMMGEAIVDISQTTILTITLSNKVASFNINLSGIPEDVNNVNVSLSSLQNSLHLDGATSGKSIATIDLELVDNTWKSGTFYTLPSVGNQINLTINTSSPAGQMAYSYTYDNPICANVPYILNGSFLQGISINSSFIVTGWNTPEIINFNFGKEDTQLPDSLIDTQDSIPTLIVEKMPTEGDLINGHFVATVMPEAFEETAIVYLLSKKEWTKMPSFYSADNPNRATEVVESYVEGNLRAWTIPTKDEINLISGVIGVFYIDETNDMLSENGFPILSYGESSNGKIRYLCDQAKSSIDFKTGKVTECGKERTYHLRAIKKVRVKF